MEGPAAKGAWGLGFQGLGIFLPGSLLLVVVHCTHRTPESPPHCQCSLVQRSPLQRHTAREAAELHGCSIDQMRQLGSSMPSRLELKSAAIAIVRSKATNGGAITGRFSRQHPERRAVQSFF